MKRTEYNEHIKKIKCSDEFKEKMERMLSDSPQEVHEYEDSVQGVERARKFNISRFGALAAALVIIGGGVGFGMYDMKNMHIDPSAQLAAQGDNFPYSELYDLYKSKEVHAVASGGNELSDDQLDRLFEIFGQNKWNSIDVKDISNKQQGINVSFVFHPDGYEWFTGVYYIFQIYENGDAYFIKYDRNNSKADFIEAEYCYMFTADVYEQFKALTDEIPPAVNNTADIEESPYGDLSNMDVRFYAIGDLETYEKADGNFKSDISDETKQRVKNMLLNVKWQSMEYSETNIDMFADLFKGTFITVGFDLGTEDSDVTEATVTEDGKLLAVLTADGEEIYRIYDVGTDFYEAMKNILERNVPTGKNEFESADQDEVNAFIDENIREETQIGVSSKLLIEGYQQKYISNYVDINNIDEIKAKMKSIPWEKCDITLPYSAEYKDSIRMFSWDTVIFSDKGLLYNGTECCYRPANREDVEEIVNMLYNAGFKLLSPEMRLMIVLSEGCNFRTVQGSYSALHEVPLEASETGSRYYVQSEGTIYVDNETGGVMADGNGTELSSGEERRYAYLKYADIDRVRYDEARGEGLSTAHYDGRIKNVFHEFDYLGLYKEFVRLASEQFEKTDWECIHDPLDSDDGNDNCYAFTWTGDNEKRTINIFVDEQGKLIKYILLDDDGKTLESFELKSDCVFDSDNFEMPDMYEMSRN